MTEPAQPLDLTPIQARHQATTAGLWWNDGTEIYAGPTGIPAASVWIGETCNVDLPDRGDANGTFMANAKQDVTALIVEVLRLRELLDQRTADIADKALENAVLRAQVDAVRVWVVNTIHGSAAAEVGPLIGQRPPRIEYCPRCKRPHLDCTC